MRLKVCFTIIVLLFAFSSVKAEMYKWVDEKGVVTFKDTPPPQSPKRKKVKVYSEGDFAARSGQSAPSRQAASARPKSPAPQVRQEGQKVEVYMTSWCGYCKKTLSYLDSKGVSYAAYDIENDSAAKERYQALGGRGVPLVVIGDNKIAGYSPETMDRYLQASQ